MLIILARVNYAALGRICMVLSFLGLIVIYQNFSNDQELINKVPKMELKKDSASEMLAFDLATDKGFGSPEFHTAVFGKRFIVKGVATTIAFSEPNTEPDLNNKLPYRVMFYSEILSPLCLDKLSKAIVDKSFEKIDIKTNDAAVKFIENLCGPKVYHNDEYAGASDNIDPINLQIFCSEEIKCAKCLIAKGSPKFGNCESSSFEFQDTSAVRQNSGSKWITYESQPVTKIDYLRYQKQI